MQFPSPSSSRVGLLRTDKGAVNTYFNCVTLLSLSTVVTESDVKMKQQIAEYSDMARDLMHFFHDILEPKDHQYSVMISTLIRIVSGMNKLHIPRALLP